VDNTLRDETEDNILDSDSGRQDIIDRISNAKKAPKAAKAKSEGGDEGNAIKKKFDELKAAAGEGGDSDEDLSECPIDKGCRCFPKQQSSNFASEPPANKKAKGGEEDVELKIKAFAVYGNMANGSLDDVLVWNGQTKSGVKGRPSRHAQKRTVSLTSLFFEAWKVLKCIDGHVNGRLQK